MPSLLEAINTKYGHESDDCAIFELPIEIFLPKKDRRHVIPSLLVLNDCDIDSAGDEDELQSKCEGVLELDLAQNKLQAWAEVFKILNKVPTVTFVNLSHNILDRDQMIANPPNFDHLRNLVLNATRIPWDSVQNLLHLLPSLEELHLSRNEYDCVCLDPVNTAENVKILHFTGNPVTTWSEITKLGVAFPQLEALVLAECLLESLTLPDVDGSRGKRESESEADTATDAQSPHHNFRQLKVLNLNHTQLRSWDDVELLAKFPALRSLRLQGCPLFELGQEYTAHERRQLVIARLPNIVKLNGGDNIGFEEREDAERAFIRYYMDKPEQDRPDRYSDLSNVHGKLDPLVQVDLSPEKSVKVTFRLGDKTETRSLSVYQTVQELKVKLESFVEFPAAKMRLFYVDQVLKTSVGPEEMKFPSKQLYSYNIASGDEILIDKKM